MRSTIGFMTMMLTITGCQQMHDIGEEMKGFSQESSVRGRNIAGIIQGTYGAGHSAPQMQETPRRYCYKAQSDILCYSQPLAGQESRLVGYQEPENGNFIAAGSAPASNISVQTIRPLNADSAGNPAPRALIGRSAN